MQIRSPAVRTAAGPQFDAGEAEAELVRLRAQVAWLQAERAALWWAVGHDDLTGLPNRRLFYTLAPPLLRDAGPAAVVVVLDLNGFKPINDTCGHDAGDSVLRIVAQRLASHAGDDLVARLGGDEFAAVLTSPQPQTSGRWWQRAVAALSAAIAAPMPVAGRTHTVSASIGVAPAHDDVLIGELLRRADLAMYKAKVTGRAHVAWSTDAVNGANAAPYRTIELALFPAGHPVAGQMCAPTCDPAERHPADVAPAGTYRRDDPVWVHRDGSWRPGVVEDASTRAIMATYRCAEGSGTVVDTMSAQYVLARAAADPQLDRRAAQPGAAA